MPLPPGTVARVIALCRRFESVHGPEGVRFFARRLGARGHAPATSPGGRYLVARSAPRGVAAVVDETPGAVEVAFLLGRAEERAFGGDASAAWEGVRAVLARAAAEGAPALSLAPFYPPRGTIAPQAPWRVWRGESEARVLLRPGGGVDVAFAGRECEASIAHLAWFAEGGEESSGFAGGPFDIGPTGSTRDATRDATHDAIDDIDEATRDTTDDPTCAGSHEGDAEAAAFGALLDAALSSARLDVAHLQEAARRLLEAQRDGHCYLANLAETLVLAPRPARVPRASWTLARFLGGSARLGAHALSGDGHGALVLSPERFVRTTSDGHLVTEPVKGTSPCSDPPTPVELAVLWESEKETCEQILVTDLLRNDLALVCEPGSVAVHRPFFQRVAGPLLQMQSTVFGRLRAPLAEGAGFLPALLPAGSISGTPKKRACELIGSLEARPRGYYTGVVGMAYADGSFDSAVCIRSAFLDRRGLVVGVGAGLTVLSDPDAEVAEMELKLASMRDAWRTP